MDQDLLNYLDQRFSSIDQRFSSIDQRFSSIDQRFDQVDQRFQETGQQIQTLREETAQRFDRVDLRFDDVDQRIEKLEEEIRGAYVLIEDLQSEVRLVTADGTLNITEQLNRHREDVARKFAEIEALNRSVFEEFRGSQKKLDTRVRRLEATG